MQAVTIGPWVFAIGLVALVLGWIAANVAAWILKRRGRGDIGTPLLILVLSSLVVARLTWVAQAWPAYRASPLDILDVRDGGFSWLAGVAVLVVATLVWMWKRPGLRRTLPVGVGTGLAMWAAVALGASQLKTATYPPLPGIALQQLNGQPERLTALEGKPTVVDIWATWCGPCRSEMPMLVAASHNLHDVRFVFVDHGESASTVKRYLKRAGLDPSHVLLDSHGKLMQRYKLPGCPATLFVTPSGHVRAMHLGVLSAAALHTRVHKLVAHTRTSGSTDGTVAARAVPLHPQRHAALR